MSYILEALKKAEAERRSGGGAPSIHTPHSFAPARARRPWWRLPAAAAALAAILLAAGAAVWFITRPPALAPAPASVPAAAAVAPVASAPAAPASPAAPATPVQPPSAARTEASPAPKPPAVKRETSAEPKTKPAPRKSESKAAADKPKAAQQQQSPPPPLRQLPEHIQREIPPLEIGGYIYSGIAADRSVLINKKLMREGDEIAPGLILERMTPSGMVLNYRGHRYRSSY